MPRRCTVCAHEDLEAINKALVAGESNRRIAAQYGVSEQAVRRHKGGHLPQTLVQAHAAREEKSAIDVMAELERCFERVNLLFDACDRWLRDPADSSRYDIGPRAEELMVTYTEQGHNGRPVQRKASLAELLEPYSDARGAVLRAIEEVSNGRARE